MRAHHARVASPVGRVDIVVDCRVVAVQVLLVVLPRNVAILRAARTGNPELSCHCGAMGPLPLHALPRAAIRYDACHQDTAAVSPKQPSIETAKPLRLMGS